MIFFKDNRGSTIVLTLVVVTIVAILGTLALSMTLINFKMKNNNAELKGNFYSAENVLDEITAGLANQISKAYADAYADTMVWYIGTESATRQAKYTDAFAKHLMDSLKSDQNDQRYKLSTLTDYVDSSLLSMTEITETTPLSEADLIRDGDYVILKGIRVSFTKDGITSIIETDLKISTPPLNEKDTVRASGYYTAAVIANSGIIVDAGAEVSLTGKIYAGDKSLLGSVTDDLSLLLENGSSLTVDSDLFISTGESRLNRTPSVNVKSNTSLRVKSGSTFYSKNIVANGGLLTLQGTTYVKDDLTVNGTSSEVAISGRYVGYSNYSQVNGRAENSSAIIINGKNTSLDFTDLSELYLGGYGYVGQTSVQLKDSIAIKGNQVAYLVPSECIRYEFKNPLTATEYASILGNVSGYQDLVDLSVVTAKLSGNLASLGINREDISIRVSDNGNLIYFFVSLSGERAEEYYKAFYNASESNKARLDSYFQYYLSAFKFGTDAGTSTNVYAPGDFYISDGSYRELNVAAEDTAKIASDFAGLSASMNKDDRDNSEILFNKIIKTERIRANTTLTYESNGVKAIVTDGNYDYQGGDVSMIIAKGNVTISSDYTGIIICRGSLTIKGRTSLRPPAGNTITRLLRDNDDLKELFTDGLNFAASEELPIDDTEYRNLISYSNYNKK